MSYEGRIPKVGEIYVRTSLGNLKHKYNYVIGAIVKVRESNYHYVEFDTLPGFEKAKAAMSFGYTTKYFCEMFTCLDSSYIEEIVYRTPEMI